MIRKKLLLSFVLLATACGIAALPSDSGAACNNYTFCRQQDLACRQSCNSMPEPDRTYCLNGCSWDYRECLLSC